MLRSVRHSRLVLCCTIVRIQTPWIIFNSPFYGVVGNAQTHENHGVLSTDERRRMREVDAGPSLLRLCLNSRGRERGRDGYCGA